MNEDDYKAQCEYELRALKIRAIVGGVLLVLVVSFCTMVVGVALVEKL